MKLASVLTPLSDDNLTLAAQMRRRRRSSCAIPGRICRSSTGSKARIRVVRDGHRGRRGLPADRTDQARHRRRHRPGADEGARPPSRRSRDADRSATTSWPAPTGSGPRSTPRNEAAPRPRRSASPDSSTPRIPGRPPFSRRSRTRVRSGPSCGPTSHRFLEEIIPVAEESGVVMAMHPDDPPLPHLLGNDRIMHDVAGFERLVDLVTIAVQQDHVLPGYLLRDGDRRPGADPAARTGTSPTSISATCIGTAESFRETWQDNGQTDMAEAMRTIARSASTGRCAPTTCPRCSARTTASRATPCSADSSRTATSVG